MAKKNFRVDHRGSGITVFWGIFLFFICLVKLQTFTICMAVGEKSQQ